jgi:predicted ATPase
VLPALARCIGIDPSETPAKVLPQIVAELRAKSMLLVLDNFEQVAEQASVVAELLAQAPRVQALVTSRVALHIRGEHVHPVDPLPTDTASALFFARARAVVLDLDGSEPNRAAVERICQRLDCLPLAIELAAARARTLPLPLLLERLGTALKLESKARDLPARQQTLRATIGWSVELLSETARELFDAMGLFPAGATLDALEAVLERDPLDDVELLLEHSLVRASGEGRFDTLMTVRAYSLERLDASPVGEKRRERHAAFLADLATTANRSLRGPEGGEWRKRLVAESANIQAALAWTLADGAPAERAIIGARIAGSLGWFWYTRSDAVDGIRWLERARPRVAAAPEAVRAGVLHGLGILYDQVGRSTDAIPCLEEASALFETLGDGHAGTRCTNSLGNALRSSGDSVRARAMYELALSRAKVLGDEPSLAVAPLFNMGALALDSCDGQTALRALRGALELDRTMSNEWGIAVDTAAIGQAHLCAGDVAAAEASLVGALPKLMELGESDRVAETLAYQAAVLGKKGDPVGAVRLLAAAWALWRSKGILPTGPDLHRLEDQLRFLEGALPPEERARAENEGAAMTAEQAVAYALRASS